MALSLILLIGLSGYSYGRFVEIWNYQKLYDTADVIATVSVKEKTKRTGKTKYLEGDRRTFDVVKTVFKKHAVFKGKLEPDGWAYLHYAWSMETNVIVNGPGFTWFDDETLVYMVFLKRDDDGLLVPVSGQTQVESSFLKVQEDGETMVNQMTWIKSWIEESSKAKESNN